ncbi:MAG TPA: hypothetical protein VFZ64_15730 [Nocardioidaceae bacterium]
MLSKDTARTITGLPQAAAVPAADEDLADLVKQALTDLAKHSDRYARIFADRAGVRLAYHVRAGQIDQLSVDGRAAMRSVYTAMQVALTVEPGLDTNSFLKHVNGKTDNGS